MSLILHLSVTPERRSLHSSPPAPPLFHRAMRALPTQAHRVLSCPISYSFLLPTLPLLHNISSFSSHPHTILGALTSSTMEVLTVRDCVNRGERMVSTIQEDVSECLYHPCLQLHRHHTSTPLFPYWTIKGLAQFPQYRAGDRAGDRTEEPKYSPPPIRGVTFLTHVFLLSCVSKQA